MKFDNYADACVALAVDLVNSGGPGRAEELGDVASLRRFLRAHVTSSFTVRTREEVADVRALRERLRAVFTAPDEASAAAVLNDVLDRCGARPQLSAHDGEPWHLHYAPTDAPLAARLGAEAAMGLAAVAVSDGFSRLRLCGAAECDDAFVDISRNRSRKYCTTECANRTNVAAWRARQRTG